MHTNPTRHCEQGEAIPAARGTPIGIAAALRASQ